MLHSADNSEPVASKRLRIELQTDVHILPSGRAEALALQLRSCQHRQVLHPVRREEACHLPLRQVRLGARRSHEAAEVLPELRRPLQRRGHRLSPFGLRHAKAPGFWSRRFSRACFDYAPTAASTAKPTISPFSSALARLNTR